VKQAGVMLQQAGKPQSLIPPSLYDHTWSAHTENPATNSSNWPSGSVCPT